MPILGIAFSLITIAGASSAPPPTTVKPVIEEIQGVKVSDPYRWLEDTKDPVVQKWTEAQAKFARQYLDHLPNLKKIRGTLQKWNDFQAPSYGGIQFKAGLYFAYKLQPPKNQPMIVTFKSPIDLKDERVLFDPNVGDAKGATAIDFFEPSLDGKSVAISLSKGGSEIGTLQILNVADAKMLSEQIPSVSKPTGGGSVAWNKDGTGFFYTRYPHEGERPKEDLDFFLQVYFHKLGTSIDKDTYSIGKEFPRIGEVALETSPDGRYTLARVANGDGGEVSHYLYTPDSKWIQLTKFEDKARGAQLGFHNDLYFKSVNGSPRGKILRLDLAKPKFAKAEVVVPESDGVVEGFVVTDTELYVDYLQGGPSLVKAFSTDFSTTGKNGRTVALPANSSIGGVSLSSNGILVRMQGYTQPPAWYEVAAGPASAITKTAMVKKSPVDFSDIEVVREMATSRDGTKVPVSILYKKGLKRNGKNPTVLSGYGGYGISMTPYFNADLHYWFDRGGVYAIANLRGGGEFGEEWHLTGNLTKKQNVFDDFIACAEHLIKEKYTDSKHLAIQGGSNGGLLMGAALTQRPELFGAVVSHVGIYDMLRVENDSNGAFNVTEFGTVKNPAQFQALYAYSPYHHVADDGKYPATLLLTGANDGRVPPYHSKKMAARLQALPKAKNVLLRVTFDGGHGVGRSVSQKVEEEADVYAFLLSQVGGK